ncbi:TRAP transporter substrate-binding protein [Treponema sp.]|uniref:TRAP transporter substrate-binding protein n=1 Tax=Treponema sp. TaxID=166 RepID=UPI00388E6E5C
MKCFNKIMLLSLFSFSFLSCNFQNQKPVTLVMAEVNPANTVAGKMDAAFKEKVEELSKGKIKIHLQYSGILGDEPQIMKLIVDPDSSIHLARVSASLVNYGDKQSKLLTIPFTFEDDEHFWKFASSELAEEFLDEPYKKGLGVKGLFYAEEGFRHFFSTTRINTLDDLKNKKIRSSNAKVLQDLVESLNAEPVVVPFTDLYAALLTGKVDVAEQPVTNYLSNSFNDVAPYMILDGHMLGAVQVVINSKIWDSLSKKQQEILKEAGKYASNYCKTIVENENKLALETLKKQGVVITEISDKTPWKTACKKMITESSQDFPELYQKILDLNK